MESKKENNTNCNALKSTYHTITKGLIVKPKGEPIYSEMATEVYIDDDAGGPYVVIEQHGRTDVGKVCIDQEEWPLIKDAVEQMLAVCRGEEA